jgi:hypothetical protein
MPTLQLQSVLIGNVTTKSRSVSEGGFEQSSGVCRRSEDSVGSRERDQARPRPDHCRPAKELTVVAPRAQRPLTGFEADLTITVLPADRA